MASPTKTELPEFEIGGKYRVHGPVLGKGAWSEVRRCKPLDGYACPVSGVSDLVVKMIDKAHLVKLTRGDEAQAEGEVQRELNTLSRLPQHPNIAVFIESIKSDSHFHLIFEAAPNGDLCEKILGQPSGKLDALAARKYSYQMVQSILHCHRAGIAHRDIKPENMLLGEGDMLKLTDFGLGKTTPQQNNGTENAIGISLEAKADDVANAAKALLAKFFPEPEALLCSEVVGTPYYGAPEMFEAKSKGAKYDGYLADAWSLGVVVFIMLTGSFPFSPPKGVSDKETFEALRKASLSISSEVPPIAADFIRKLLTKDPTRRMKVSQALDHEWLEPVVIDEEIKALGKVQGNGDIKDLASCPEILQRQMMRLLRREALKQQTRTDFPLTAPPPGPSGGLASSAGSKRASSPGVSSGTARRGATPTTNTVSPVPSPARRGATPTRPRLGGTSPGPTVRSATPVKNNASSSAGVSAPSTPKPTTPKPGVGSRTTPLSSPAPSTAGARTTPARTGSPLARASPTVRRGTPLRTVPASTTNAATPAQRRTPSAGASTSTPVRRPGAMPLKSPAPNSPNGTSSSGAGASSASKVGQKVTYKGKDATIRFRGETGFAPGLWLGLEMAQSGGEGLHDGRSYVDKVRYFECPKGHGVFVRESQVTKK